VILTSVTYTHSVGDAEFPVYRSCRFAVHRWTCNCCFPIALLHDVSAVSSLALSDKGRLQSHLSKRLCIISWTTVMLCWLEQRIAIWNGCSQYKTLRLVWSSPWPRHTNSEQPPPTSSASRQRLTFKIVVLVSKCVYSAAPVHLHELCIAHSKGKRQRSASTVSSCQECRHQLDSGVSLWWSLLVE